MEAHTVAHFSESHLMYKSYFQGLFIGGIYLDSTWLPLVVVAAGVLVGGLDVAYEHAEYGDTGGDDG